MRSFIARTLDSETLSVLHCQALAFPVLAVIFACLAFLCGGSCALWQWWAAFAVTLVTPLFAHKRQSALKAGLLLVLLISSAYVILSFYTDEHLCSDYPEYHLPAIRLLIEGWNPALDPDLTQTLSKLDLQPWDMRYLHVVFCEKAVWIFNAVAYQFFRQPFAISYSLNPFLELALLLSAIKFSRLLGWHWLAGACLTLLTIFFASYTWAVDDAVVYASAILLMSMSGSLRTGRLQIPELCLSSFWLMNAKMSSLLSCFVFWCVFSVAWLWKNRKTLPRQILPLSVSATLLTASLALASWSPLITSFKRYGHPLYPMATVDQQKHPIMDIAWHFRYRNPDGDLLGYWGNFVNAYVSPTLVKAYYNHKLNRTDFSPRCWEWDWECGKGADSALSAKARLMLIGALVLLACTKGMRFLALLFFIGLFCVPQQYFGYLRYSSWINFLVVLAWFVPVYRLTQWKTPFRIAFIAIGVLLMAKHGTQSLLGEAAYFGETTQHQGAAAETVFAASPEDIFSWDTSKEIRKPEHRPYIPPVSSKRGHRTINNTKLILRQLGIDATVIPYTGKECPPDQLTAFHGYYFRRLHDKPTNLGTMSLFNRVHYVVLNKLGPYFAHGIKMVMR